MPRECTELCAFTSGCLFVILWGTDMATRLMEAFSSSNNNPAPADSDVCNYVHAYNVDAPWASSRYGYGTGSCEVQACSLCHALKQASQGCTDPADFSQFNGGTVIKPQCDNIMYWFVERYQGATVQQFGSCLGSAAAPGLCDFSIPAPPAPPGGWFRARSVPGTHARAILTGHAGGTGHV